MHLTTFRQNLRKHFHLSQWSVRGMRSDNNVCMWIYLWSLVHARPDAVERLSRIWQIRCRYLILLLTFVRLSVLLRSVLHDFRRMPAYFILLELQAHFTLAGDKTLCSLSVLQRFEEQNIFAMRHAIHHPAIICGEPINRTVALCTRCVRAGANVSRCISRHRARIVFHRNIGLFVYANAINPVNISRKWRCGTMGEKNYR